MTITRGRQARSRQLARENVISLLTISLEVGGDLYAGTEAMDADEMREFIAEVRRIIARVQR